MELSRDLLFFFGALGAFNSLILGLYFLLFKKRYPSTDFLLGLLFVLFSVRAGVSCLYFFGDVSRQLIKLGLSAHLLLGPVTLHYVRAQLKSNEKQANHSLMHISIVALLLTLLSVFFDFYTWDYTIRYSIHALLTVYLVITGIITLPQFAILIKGGLKQMTSAQREAIIGYLGVVMVCLGFVISLYTNYILGPLCFSVILYIGIGSRLLIKRITPDKKSYQHKLSSEEIAPVIARLQRIMKDDKPYKDPDFSMGKLASQLSVSRHFLSQMLNDNMNLRYTDLINEHRIEEAVRLIEKNPHYNLEAIAHEVGFNSKSTFYNTFKKIKGTTPSKFRSETSIN